MTENDYPPCPNCGRPGDTTAQYPHHALLRCHTPKDECLVWEYHNPEQGEQGEQGE